MKTRTVIATLAIAGVLGVTALTSVPALARGWGDGHERMGGMQMPVIDFDALDTDGDGRVTAEEFAAARAERIKALDADGDGFVSREEMIASAMNAAQARIEKRVTEMFGRLDADGDGRLGAAEILARPMAPPERMFGMLDADGDGAVSRAELDAMRARMRDGAGSRMRGEQATGPRGRMREGDRSERHRGAPGEGRMQHDHRGEGRAKGGPRHVQTDN